MLTQDNDSRSLKELVSGKAIFVVIASGDDDTPDGHFASPVQMSFLLGNGEFVGRLPDNSISGDFFDLLVKDYIGTVHNDPLYGSIVTAFETDVDKG